MTKTLLLRNAASFTVLALILEFLLLPYSYFVVFPLVQGEGYAAGLVLLSLPRLVAVVILLAVMRVMGGVPVAIAAALYSIVLALRFVFSETYIQPNNLYALGTALVPYVAALAGLIAGAVLLQGPLARGSSESQDAPTSTTS